MSTPEPATILVVDDHPVNREVVSTLLARMGYRCTMAENGEQALHLLQEQPFDLVLMDCTMPGMSGIDTTRHLKDPANGSPNREIPVIALTAHVTETNRAQCRQAGMSGFLEKPINIQALGSVLNSFLAAGHQSEGN